VDFDSIEKLFLALEGREEPRLAELRFLLSLLLMRKRRIKMVRVKRTEEAEFMICRRPRREEIYRVQVFDLTSERAAELKAELERIFEGAGAEELQVPLGVGDGAGDGAAESGEPAAQQAAEPSPAAEQRVESSSGAAPQDSGSDSEQAAAQHHDLGRIEEAPACDNSGAGVALDNSPKA